MRPREHGAYGQLLFPLATALAIGRPTAAALALGGAAIAAFLAHEPLLVLLGRRGVRAARELRARAWRWFALTAGVALVLGLGAVLLAPSAVRVGMAAPVLFACLFGVFVLTDREHTTAGETVAALAFASLAYPEARAVHASHAAALTCAAAFAVAFVAGTLSVRAVVANTRRPPAVAARAVAGCWTVGGVVALGLLTRAGYPGQVSGAAPWAALPMCAVGFVLAVAPPSAVRLRVVGWTLVAATTATALVLIAALR